MDILLIEDDPSLRLLLRQMLTRYGHRVRACASGEEAWESYQQQESPLIILDWNLPGMSGMECCRRIRATAAGAYAYIWVITGCNSREDLLDVLAVGANDYLVKPIELELLEVRVRIAEQQARSLQQRRRDTISLASARDELERRVLERTNDLNDTIQAMLTEIGQRQQAETELEQIRDQLRALASHLLTIQEEQQKRISREIHDELGQAMTALRLDLGWLSSGLEQHQDAQRAKIERMIPLVSGTIKTIQRICAELRPGILDDLGLAAALEWLVQEFSTRTGLRCQLELEPEDLDVSPDLATTLFRICQESLTNVMRHARASQVKIRLQQEQEDIRLRIMDDGIGIAPGQAEHPMSLGLMGMRERVLPFNGQVSIQGGPGLGTEIRVRVPLNTAPD